MAARLGVHIDSITRMLTTTRQRRAAGLPLRPRDIPPPDLPGRSPLWHEATIAAWIKGRPGHGGRPRKSA